MSGNPAVDGNPKELYLLCRNTGYDTSNPDPLAENAPDMSPPDPADPNFYHSMQVISQVWVADDNPNDANAAHRHWMPAPNAAAVSQEDAGNDGHFHYSWVRNDGGQIWSTENTTLPGGSDAGAAEVEAYDVDGDGDVDIIINPPAPGTAAVAVHDHEVDVMQIINSLGEQAMLQRPKWMLVIAKCNTWTHQHWTDNGGGRTIIIAERPYISGDDADPATWVFEAKAPNTAWDTAYRDDLNNFWRSRFGLALPVDDGSGDKGVENDRRLISWFSAINSYQLKDESRFG